MCGGVGGGEIKPSLDLDVLQNHNTLKCFVLTLTEKNTTKQQQIYIKDIGSTADNVFKFNCSLSKEIFLTEFLSLVSLTEAESVTFYDIAKIILPRTT